MWEATLPEAFEARAERAPEATALVVDGEAMSYADLNARASRLAHYLIDHGVGPEHVVGVALPRSSELAVATLGVLKAGAACLPLDLDLPAEKIAHIVEDAEPSVVICHGAGLEHLRGVVAQHRTSGTSDPAPVSLLIDDPATSDEIAGHSPRDPSPGERGRVMTDHAAYVFYTPGATGPPKGVVITHHNLVGQFARAGWRFGPDEVVGLVHSCSDHVSAWETWSAWSHGGQVVVVPAGIGADELLEVVVRTGVTVLDQTSSEFSRLLDADRDRPDLASRWALRHVVLAGEPIDLGVLESWYARHGDQRPTLYAAYGTAETTGRATHVALTKDQVSRGIRHPLGRSERGLHVVDEALRPVPAGSVGELCVGGAGVARGYFGQRGLTSQTFVAEPGGAPGARMVRSGDLVRVDRDLLDFVGRAHEEGDGDEPYYALINDHDQYSLWPARTPVPTGWSVAHGPDDRQSCLDHIEIHWTDLRPAGPPQRRVR
jgi:nonribosomal peptide synthetase DhbF